MLKIILIILFLSSQCFAQIVIDAGDGVLIEKPDIDPEKILDENEQILVKDALWNDDVKLIFKELVPAKNDYTDAYDRGTVKYTEKNRNYSFCKVIIPEGTTVRDCNFTQRISGTEAIQGEDLIFIDCNLVNCIVNPKWTVIDCNTSEVDFSKEQ